MLYQQVRRTSMRRNYGSIVTHYKSIAATFFEGPIPVKTLLSFLPILSDAERIKSIGVETHFNL